MGRLALSFLDVNSFSWCFYLYPFKNVGISFIQQIEKNKVPVFNKAPDSKDPSGRDQHKTLI
jgi:hypothetical protein